VVSASHPAAQGSQFNGEGISLDVISSTASRVNHRLSSGKAVMIVTAPRRQSFEPIVPAVLLDAAIGFFPPRRSRRHRRWCTVLRVDALNVHQRKNLIKVACLPFEQSVTHCVNCHNRQIRMQAVYSRERDFRAAVLKFPSRLESKNADREYASWRRGSN
jgi:hypothetical protein